MSSVIGSVVGGIFGNKSAKSAANAQRDAAALAAQQFRPFAVSSPVGSVTPDGDSFTFGLSGALSNLLAQAQTEAGQDIGQTAGGILGRLNELAAPEEARTRRTTRERLFRSGRLGTSGGIREIRETEDALARARLEREILAEERAFQRRQTAFGNVLSLSQLPTIALGPLATARNPGQAIAAQGIIDAAAIRGNQQLAFSNALTPAISTAATAAFDQIFNPSSVSAFSGVRSTFQSLFGPSAQEIAGPF